MMRTQTYKLASTYIHLPDGPESIPVPVGPDFWSKIQERTELHSGRLVTQFHMTQDWDMWEQHPLGEEVIYLLAGSLDIVLQEPTGVSTIELREPSFCIVPAGVWHTAKIHLPSDVLEITRGEGTQHKPVNASG